MTAAMTDADIVLRLGLLLPVAHLVGTWAFAMPRRANRPRHEVAS